MNYKDKVTLATGSARAYPIPSKERKFGTFAVNCNCISNVKIFAHFAAFSLKSFVFDCEEAKAGESILQRSCV
jgi:hypothetical protein